VQMLLDYSFIHSFIYVNQATWPIHAAHKHDTKN